MRYLRYIFVVFVLGTFSLNSSLFANEEVQNLDLLEEAMESPSFTRAVSYSKKQTKEEDAVNINFSVKVRFPTTKTFLPSKNFFFQTNIGVGFLYFSGLQGNLGGALLLTDDGDDISAPLKGRLSYNRTPLFEYLLGYQYSPWVKLALSYQYEGNVSIRSKPLLNSDATELARKQFCSNLSLNGILAKVYLEFPYAIVWKSLAINSYLAAGVGPGWQTWTRNYGNVNDPNSLTGGDQVPFKQSISANAVWMLDSGLRIQKSSPNNIFSLVLGCKYNQWGQARNIGSIKKEGELKFALFKPVRVKTVYQFAPYLGVQWSFLPNQFPGYTVKGKSTKVWLPYWANSKTFQCPRSIWTQFNAGIGFLYFSGLRGNLIESPFDSTDTSFINAPLRGRLSYNRSPLFEYLLGYQFNQWLKLAFSYQHQARVFVTSKPVNAFGSRRGNNVVFNSTLSLDSVLAKVYLELPYSMIWRGLAANPYLAAGVGPGWQSWTQPQALYFDISNLFMVINPFRQRFNANAVWMLDLGLRVQSALPSNTFSVVMGCKYNQWGQARNLGGLSHQASLKAGLIQPVRIKTVYQFAPYLGVQWDFSPEVKSGYQLKGKNPKTWVPYWACSRDFQCLTNIWVQFNVGLGFVYFSGIKGNLMGTPSALFLAIDSGTGAPLFRDIPLKGKFYCNRSPLFDYLVGYQFNSWLKLALSYQHQSSITVVTKALPAYSAAEKYARFRSDLSLNAVMPKIYLELPYSMIWRSLSTNPYLALGVGPGWQSWTNLYVNYSGQLFPMCEKTSTSVAWMVDMGFRIQSAYPQSKFSVSLGCKYNQWGQARNLGNVTQQGANKTALGHPLSIKIVYQFAPYLGVQWNF